MGKKYLAIGAVVVAVSSVVIFYNFDKANERSPLVFRKTVQNETARVAFKEPIRQSSDGETSQHSRNVFQTTGGRTLDLQDLSIRQYLDKTVSLARTGDADAAYRVYQIEAVCARLPLMQVMYNGLSSESDKLVFGSEISRTKSECADVSPAEVAERFAFLDRAISSGNTNAILDYRSEGPNGNDLSVADPNDPNVIAWKVRANQMLEALAQQGDRNAWTLLSLDYQLGEVTQRNYASAVKYQVALVASKDANADVTGAPFVKDMIKNMDSSTLSSSISQGRALAKQFPLVRGAS